jgi:hypothetical protein
VERGRDDGHLFRFIVAPEDRDKAINRALIQRGEERALGSYLLHGERAPGRSSMGGAAQLPPLAITRHY